MASSNKNWPSMFRSKPCGDHHHHHDRQVHHHDEIHTPSFTHYSACPSSPAFTTAPDRVPHPKPRWNPKPEQIQILESIFNSGMINPPRDEIKKIRIRLQEYGQVGDANVFYWFQNRKSRTKHKLRLLQQNLRSPGSDHSISNNNISPALTSGSDGANPSGGPVHQKYGLFPGQDNDFLVTEPAGFHLPVHDGPSATQVGFGYSDHQPSDVVVPAVTEPEIPFSGEYSADTVPSIMNQIQDKNMFGQCGDLAAKSMVFINDMPFEVASGQQFNVREAFGNDAVLINSSGHPILTDQWGRTLHPLQDGAVYYLI
ncbi:PREDICTED: WUSCHEL-related homeobox 8-like [Tarenaya hassleriana]|uniref:WUSCHEL-related homeobox 8-like n=1 Tax=Tarenaya hassleriana TaxID=28532 RepID=UPI00053C989D|nr:PREDICTED: WUSCHEL-related homeobox 8-like [Tarenaya hassleriana]